MFRKLANIFNQNQPSRILDFAEVNRSNHEVSLPGLEELKSCLEGPVRRQLLKELQTGWASASWQERLKYLIATHHLVTTAEDEEIAELYAEQPPLKSREADEEGSDGWVSRELVDYYAEYLRRLCAHFEMYRDSRRLKDPSLEALRSVELTAGCFKAVNLLNFILKTQVNLNKVGRYYPKLTVMCQLFGMYAKDIKTLHRQLERVIDRILFYYSELSNEMLRHSFVFLVEVQKTFDRLQEFFHNRYFYQSVDVAFPQVRPVDPLKYKQLVRYIKATDKTIDIPRVCTLPPRRNRRGTPEKGFQANQTICGGEMSAEVVRFEERFATYKEI